MKNRAFTLIELLVVIAIIAILAAILFPVFAQAKIAAQKAASISNQKQISLACLMYAHDYDDNFSQSAYFAPPVTPDPRPVIVSVYDLIGPYTKNLEIFVAPGHDGHDWRQRLNDMNLTTPGRFRYASYIPNLGLFGENFCAAPIPALQKYTPTWSQTALPSAADTIMFFDGYIKKMAPLEYHNFMGQARYSDKVVVNYADGHTTTVAPPGIPNGGELPAGIITGSDRLYYYNWSPGELLTQDNDLQDAPNTFINPYNDLHGVPGTNVTDSEDQSCG